MAILSVFFFSIFDLSEMEDLLGFGVDASVFVQSHAKGHLLDLRADLALDRRCC